MPIVFSILFFISFLLFFYAFRTYIIMPKIREETLYWATAMFTLAIAFLIQLLGYANIIPIKLSIVLIVYNLNYLAWLLEYRALFILFKYNSHNISLLLKKFFRLFGLLSLWIFIIYAPIIGAKIDGAKDILLTTFTIPSIFDFAINFYFYSSIILILGVLVLLASQMQHDKIFSLFFKGFFLIGIKEILCYLAGLGNHTLYSFGIIISLFGVGLIFWAIYLLFTNRV